MSGRWQWLGAAVWIAATACGPGDPETGPPRVDTLANGRVVAANSVGGVWTNDTRWRLVEDLRIGAAEGDGAEQFGRVDLLIADSAGRVYVADGIALEVRVFDPDGAFLYRVGGEGEGPSELAVIAGMDVGPEGCLWVVDAGNHRYSVFDRAGALVTNHPRQVASYADVPARFLAAGGFVEWSSLTDPDRTHRRMAAVRFVPPASFDTIAQMRPEFGTVAGGLAVTPWDAHPVAWLSREGDVWVGRSTEYAVHRRSLAGDTLLTFVRPAAPAPVPSFARDSLVDFFGRFGLEVERSEVPREQPVLRRIVDDGAGHVYVLPQEAGVPEGSALDVFRTTGVYLGRMKLPEPMGVGPVYPSPHVTPTHVYVRVFDDLGVHYVSRLRIERPAQ